MKHNLPCLILGLLLALCLSFPSIADNQGPIQKIDSLQSLMDEAQGKDLVDIYNEISWNYRNIRIDSSLIYAQRAYHLAQSMDYELGISKSLNFIGVAKRNHSNFLGALENFFEALKHAEQSRNLVQLSYTLINIGNIYVFQTNFDGAIDYFERALINANKLEDLDLKAYCHINLGRSYTGLKKYEEGEIHIEKAIALREEQNNLEGVVISKVDLANLYVLSDQMDKAIETLDATMADVRKLGHSTTLAYMYMIYSRAYLKKNQIAKSLEFNELSFEICSANNIKKVESDLLLLKSNIYEQANDLSKALHYLHLHTEKKDSIFSEENTRKIESLHASYTAEKKEAETRYLKQQTELNQIIIQRQKVIIWLTIIGLVLFIGIAIVSIKAASDRKKMTNQIEKQKEDAFKHNNSLIDLNHEKNNLIRILSHDLRAPINNIKGLTQVHQSAHQFDEADNQMLDHIVNESDRLLNMITKILNVEALEDETRHYKSDRINLNYVTEQVISNYQSSAKAKEISIHSKLVKDGVFILGDQIHIYQILENLISNAIKFSQKNTVINIELVNLVAENRVQIRIKDQGPGLTEEDKRKIFTKFQTLSAKPTGNEESTGLGLSIVKQYTEQMDGKIWVESTYGEGSTFIVEFLKTR
ncbi:tetratricopeptide repeat-containing sensor histidine kinase [Reichenbachiella ulvae]|uniref:histidine kinase n=1 Tax=Reichenbachiella ulvae TaxID=2980104 RepID=A0ABT3CSN5_9BACT|nr:tetratricopeptide repeat-containing sensor histidine kinase [Reichenbachiella ulvae]MCV9386263.1 tetratricopeptide repeat-containing sensor histidine kinase [Reichenbachiella ulvae]